MIFKKYFCRIILSVYAGCVILQTKPNGGGNISVYTGNEHFSSEGMPAGYLLTDFWAWQASDLLNNTLRGVLAEFIVAKALGLDTSGARQDWDAYDLLADGQWRIEVKSSAYLQSWEQQESSRLQFGIRPTRAWSPEAGFAGEVMRRSDLYVFCVFGCRERSEADPLNFDQWEFYILPTFVLNDSCGEQQSISLSRLLELHAERSDYLTLGLRVRRMLLRTCSTGADEEIEGLSRKIAGNELAAP